MNIKYFIALLEIKRGFSGNVPKGVGIRDFVILIFFISLVSILGFLFLVTYKDIPFKIEQTLLGSTNKNEIPIKYQIHYHRLDSGLDYDMVNFLKKDKRLENIKIIPEREVNLNGDIRLVGQPLKGGARLNAISLPISSPFWKKIISWTIPCLQFSTDGETCRDHTL